MERSGKKNVNKLKRFFWTKGRLKVCLRGKHRPHVTRPIKLGAAAQGAPTAPPPHRPCALHLSSSVLCGRRHSLFQPLSEELQRDGPPSPGRAGCFLQPPRREPSQSLSHEDHPGRLLWRPQRYSHVRLCLSSDLWKKLQTN